VKAVVDCTRAVALVVVAACGRVGFDPRADAVPQGPDAPPPPRVADGLVALYTFEEGSGVVVRDVSGVAPALDLTIQDEGAVTWGASSLAFNASTVASSADPEPKIRNACGVVGALTVEAWLRPDSLGPFPNAPLRILSLSGNSSERNFTLGQTPPGASVQDPFDAYTLRVRTSTTTINGTPGVHSPAGAVTLEQTHVLATASVPGSSAIFVNGIESARMTLDGDFSTWQDYQLAIGNEVDQTRPWLGELWLVAVYCRALAPGEALQNFLAGP
jgi:hypothetical protein